MFLRFQASAANYQNQVTTLSAENERLRGQLTVVTAGLAGDHERRLDDVAQQVVRALLTQKVPYPIHSSSIRLWHEDTVMQNGDKGAYQILLLP